MAKKLMSAVELTTTEKQLNLPAGWLATLVSKYGPYLVQLVVDLLTGQPAPTPPASFAAKSCEDCCKDACTKAAEGIIAMHGGCPDGAGASFAEAAVAAYQACEVNP